MIELRNGEHTIYESQNGTTYWVCNVNGSYHVETKHGSKWTATKEIKGEYQTHLTDEPTPPGIWRGGQPQK